MLTNLIATIVFTLSTNVTEMDNAIREEVFIPNTFAFITPASEKTYRVTQPATERRETTTVTETKSIKFEIDGKKFTELLSTRTLQSTTKTYKLKQEWTESRVETNNLVWEQAANVVSISSEAVITDIVITK